MGKGPESSPLTLTLLLLTVSEYRVQIMSTAFLGTPSPCRILHNADQPTESKACLRSTYAGNTGFLNSLRFLANKWRARILSTVDRPGVNPLCCFLCFLRSSGCILARRTWKNTFPGILRRVIPCSHPGRPSPSRMAGWFLAATQLEPCNTSKSNKTGILPHQGNYKCWW